jgi:hypothetical protein
MIISIKSTKLIVCLAVLSTLVLASTIDQHPQNKQFLLENFQFTNYTGSGISSDMVSNYIKQINNAYSYFGNDSSKATDYISNQLENLYGYAYSVIILQTN